MSKAFFDSLDAAEVARLMADPFAENLHLDYISAKGYKRNPKFNIENIAKPLCGFANGDGGVILYGIGTSSGKGANGGDLPGALDGQIPPGLAEAIKSAAAVAASPAIAGVVIEKVSGLEVLKVWIPSSPDKPHQTGWIYYRRLDDGVRPLDHASIDALFRARIGRELQLFPLLRVQEVRRVDEILFHIYVINRGNAPALNAVGRVGGLVVGRSALVGSTGDALHLHLAPAQAGAD